VIVKDFEMAGLAGEPNLITTVPKSRRGGGRSQRRSRDGEAKAGVSVLTACWISDGRHCDQGTQTASSKSMETDASRRKSVSLITSILAQ
jgi:hypothetical protein